VTNIEDGCASDYRLRARKNDFDPVFARINQSLSYFNLMGFNFLDQSHDIGNIQKAPGTALTL
jgi:hypothetical protein